MCPRGAHVVRAGAGAPVDLGCENDVFAGDVQIPHELTEGLLALSLRVDIGRVKEVDAGIDEDFDQFVGSSGLPDALAPTKSQGAEAKT
jgi:hypothetical protein